MDHALRQRLQTFEERLLQNATRRMPARAAALLHRDFREVGASGRVFSRDEILDAMSKESGAQRSMTGFEAREIAAGVVLATYQAVRSVAGEPDVCTRRSSLWVEEEGNWKMLYHQGTPIDGPR